MADTVAARSTRIPSDGALILVSLLGLAAAAWALLFWQSVEMDGEMSLTMAMSAPLFIALWIAMMVAIMYPTAAPMILMFAKIHGDKKGKGQAFVPTWVFAGSYILMWSAIGIAAYGLALAGDELADQSAWIMDNAARTGAAVLIAAGVYQLTPLKDVCLGKCRSPISFILHSWRDGYTGSFRMGLDHAVYCLGCCWMLFLILFPLGMISIAVLALITALIFAEKVLPLGRQIGRAAGVALVLYGSLVLFVPDALPMTMDDGHASMADMDMGTNDGAIEGMNGTGRMESEMADGGGAMDGMSEMQGMDSTD